MPYRKAQFEQGEYYHLYNRAAGREVLFRESDNYVFVLRKVKRYAAQYRVAVVAYCLMANQYHLLVRQDGSMPAGLLPQPVFNSYTKAFNKRYEHSGTLFEGRFEAAHVDREPYLIHLCRYIHGNPVKAGLIRDSAEWPHSNFLEWVGGRKGTLVDQAFVREYFPAGVDYRRFVEDYLAGLAELPRGIEAYLAD